LLREQVQRDHGAMAIDDPLQAAEDLVASDERQRLPITEWAQDLVAVAKCIPGVREYAGPADLVLRKLNQRNQENRDYLLDVLTDELKRIRGRLEHLSEEHRQFLEHDYMELVLDGLKRSENIRSKERIARIAKILAHAADVGPSNSADCAEEMMRVAMDLTDQDVGVLREIDRAQAKILEWSRQPAPMDPVNDCWKADPPKVEGMSPAAIVSTCEKLQSFGLVTRVDRNNFKLPLTVTPYGILQKGHDFVEYIRGVAESEQTTMPQ
jgi:hypothetical protein